MWRKGLFNCRRSCLWNRKQGQIFFPEYKHFAVILIRFLQVNHSLTLTRNIGLCENFVEMFSF